METISASPFTGYLRSVVAIAGQFSVDLNSSDLDSN